jgi:hypothetical protein
LAVDEKCWRWVDLELVDPSVLHPFDAIEQFLITKARLEFSLVKARLFQGGKQCVNWFFHHLRALGAEQHVDDVHELVVPGTAGKHEAAGR